MSVPQLVKMTGAFRGILDKAMEGLSLGDSEATDAQSDIEEWLGDLRYVG